MLALPVTSSNLYDREIILLNIIKNREKKSSSLKLSKTCREAVSYEEKEKTRQTSSYPAKEISKAR